MFEFKYGKKTISVDIPEKNYAGTLIPNEIVHDRSGADEINYALDNPAGSERLEDIVKPGESVVIVTSDITRPFPGRLVIPELVKRLHSAGVSDSDITIVFALGSHRRHTEDEKKYLTGDDVYSSGINLLDSEMDLCINLGACRNGTPVDIFRPVAEADRLICVGNIEFHYFAGYSGGAKALMPGVSSHAAIQANHSNMTNKNAAAGRLDDNPVRQDIDQVGEFIKIDFILNVILDNKKEIVKAVAGHYLEAHRNGCRYLDRMNGVEFASKADIVIASPGGYPKDINLYQAQKGLDNAKYAVKDGGIIILAASAAEGFGEKTFESWMKDKTPSEMLAEIESNFVLGGHKAAAIAMILQKAEIFMVSDLGDETVKSINFIPFKSLQAALDAAVGKMGERASVLVMPDAGATIPLLKDVSEDKG